MIEENETAQQDHTQHVWALLSLERWQQAFLDSPALTATPPRPEEEDRA